MSSAGVFGGTFDPVHNGHLITAEKVFQLRNLDKIIFIPAFISPFKKEIDSTSAVHRLNMLKAAIEGVSIFEWSDIEINSGGISYTINTLRKLKDRFQRLDLIIGYDNILDFPDWKEPDEIIKIATLVVLKRLELKTKVKHNRFFEQAVFAETPVIDISSTAIRERVKNNLPIDNLVPERVKKYIYKNNLYKD